VHNQEIVGPESVNKGISVEVITVIFLKIVFKI